ncbi:MAG: rhodanese-like domain-containing protein [Lachnospiraceae bacterium]|nr:rhodanese-like domain-containing protein [Lachnospiraceae bacterium]
MKHSQKARVIVGTCILLVGFFSLFILYKNFRPSRGLPYEQLTMEQAVKYMAFERGYALIDVGTPEEYEAYHIPDAVNMPFDNLTALASENLPDYTQMIYVCAADHQVSKSAARKLCSLGYTSVTEIGSSLAYRELESELLTEGESWFDFFWAKEEPQT